MSSSSMVLEQIAEYFEFDGDGDEIINPGETVSYFMTIENFVPWENAQNVVLVLEPLSDELTLSNEELFLAELNSGNSFSALSTDFSPSAIKIGLSLPDILSSLNTGLSLGQAFGTQVFFSGS